MNEDITLLEKYQREAVVLMAIQHIGNATVEEIHEYSGNIKKIDQKPFKLQKKSIRVLCEKLKSKGFVSIGYDRKEGETTTFYKMQKGYVKFPETAQIKDVIKDESVKDIIKLLEGSKGSRKTKIDRQYYLAKVEWEVIDGVAGGQPSIDGGIQRHIRDGEAIIFTPNHFKRYIQNVLKLGNYSAYIINDIGTNYGYAKLNGIPMQTYTFHPSVRGDIRGASGGASAKTLEILPKGSTIETVLTVPGNVIPSDKLKKLLDIGGQYAPKGFGAYASRWGKLKLKDFQVVKKLDFEET